MASHVSCPHAWPQADLPTCARPGFAPAARTCPSPQTPSAGPCCSELCPELWSPAPCSWSPGTGGGEAKDERKEWHPPGIDPPLRLTSPQARPSRAGLRPLLAHPQEAPSMSRWTRGAQATRRGQSPSTPRVFGAVPSLALHLLCGWSPHHRAKGPGVTPHGQPWPLPAAAADVAWAEHSPPSWSRPSAPWRPPRPRGTPCAASSRPHSSCGWHSPRTHGRTPRSSAAGPGAGRRQLEAAACAGARTRLPGAPAVCPARPAQAFPPGASVSFTNMQRPRPHTRENTATFPSPSPPMAASHCHPHTAAWAA